jgi:hypothetical protein
MENLASLQNILSAVESLSLDEQRKVVVHIEELLRKQRVNALTEDLAPQLKSTDRELGYLYAYRFPIEVTAFVAKANGIKVESKEGAESG